MTINIEEKQRFSKSVLWKAQREYYETEGIKAWASEVPFYITSNPFIAHCYANIAIRFIQDWLKKNSNAISEPFYFLELGTGPGQFSYYLLTALTEMQNRLKMHSVKFRYIMSDFTEKNIHFWTQHEKLKVFLDANVLDFAQFDLESDSEIYLQRSKITLKKESLRNPLIIVANYIFDTLPADIFTIKNERIYESLVSLNAEENHLNQAKQKKWEKVKIDYTDVPVKNGYYPDEHYNDILEIYRKNISETHFLFPITVLEALKRLKMISNNNLLVLSSDKAYSTLAEQEELPYPKLTFHGSFSLMANFDAVARFFKCTGGDALLQTPREGITSAVFASGFQFKDFLETEWAVEEYVEGFSPGDYFVLHDQICNKNTKIKLEVYAAALCMSRWDPYVFDLHSESIIKLLSEADYDTVEYLTHYIPKIANNFYFVPGTDDILFDVGLFFHELENYEKAISYYEESIRLFGETHEVMFNLAVCHYELKKFEQALSLFKHSLELDPKQKDVKDWIKKAEKNAKE